MSGYKTMLFIFLFIILSGFINTFQNWKTYDLNEIGSIDLPNLMEIKSIKSQSNKDFNGLNNILNNDGADIDFWAIEKSMSKENAVLLSQVMLVTRKGNYPVVNLDISNVEQNEIIDIDKNYKESIMSGLALANAELEMWYPIKIEKKNKTLCIHLSYNQKDNKTSIIRFVEVYRFFTINKMYSLTLSCPLNKKNIWEKAFLRISGSFKIINSK